MFGTGLDALTCIQTAAPTECNRAYNMSAVRYLFFLTLCSSAWLKYFFLKGKKGGEETNLRRPGSWNLMHEFILIATKSHKGLKRWGCPGQGPWVWLTSKWATQSKKPTTRGFLVVAPHSWPGRLPANTRAESERGRKAVLAWVGFFPSLRPRSDRTRPRTLSPSHTHAHRNPSRWSCSPRKVRCCVCDVL